MSDENLNDGALQLQLDHMRRYGVQDKDPTLPRKPTYARKKSSQERPRQEAHADYEIDLHGCTVHEAEVDVESAIELALSAGYKTLRIVHGGRIGSYGPVARAIDKLLRSRLRKWVARFETDGVNDGACLVHLK